MGRPFLDDVAGLYADPARLTARTSALHQAKVAGEDVTETICNLLRGSIDAGSPVADIGCGRGSTTLALAQRFKLSRLTALDASPALLSVATQRFTAAELAVATVCGDFHRLPFEASTLDAIVAAFCLYHSHNPAAVIAEFARCLRRHGVAVLVTKSAHSYSELDQVVAESGLDPHAATRPSLYALFHSGNMSHLASMSLQVEQILHQRHLFWFTGFEHLAQYLATTPRYQIGADAGQIAQQLLAWQPDQPVTMSSTVSYVLGVRP